MIKVRYVEIDEIQVCTNSGNVIIMKGSLTKRAWIPNSESLKNGLKRSSKRDNCGIDWQWRDDAVQLCVVGRVMSQTRPVMFRWKYAQYAHHQYGISTQSFSNTSAIQWSKKWLGGLKIQIFDKLRMSSHNLPTLLVSSFEQPENRKKYSSTDYNVVMSTTRPVLFWLK